MPMLYPAGPDLAERGSRHPFLQTPDPARLSSVQVSFVRQAALLSDEGTKSSAKVTMPSWSPSRLSTKYVRSQSAETMPKTSLVQVEPRRSSLQAPPKRNGRLSKGLSRVGSPVSFFNHGAQQHHLSSARRNNVMHLDGPGTPIPTGSEGIDGRGFSPRERRSK